MSARNLLTVNGIFALLDALLLIFFPSFLAGFFGVEGDGAALQIIQLLGAALVGYGFSSWWMRNAGPSEARTAFLRAGAVGYLVVSLVSVYMAVTGQGKAIFWAAFGISFLLGILFLYVGMRSMEDS